MAPDRYAYRLQKDTYLCGRVCCHSPAGVGSPSQAHAHVAVVGCGAFLCVTLHAAGVALLPPGALWPSPRGDSPHRLFPPLLPAQGRWLEISSVSNFESYQANRLKLRYRTEDGKIELAHTLNGSSLALPRVVAALLENNQKDGKIIIPEALRPYTGFDVID